MSVVDVISGVIGLSWHPIRLEHRPLSVIGPTMRVITSVIREDYKKLLMLMWRGITDVIALPHWS
jgi:hypothetical protein